MQIYADTNIYCRPFDDLSQSKIALETESIFVLFESINKNKLSLTTSDILKLELLRTDPLKQIRVKSFLSLADKHVSESENIKDLAYQISKCCKISPRDALHLSSAVVGRADYFLTCDSGLLRKSDCLHKNFCLIIINPVQFVWQILWKKTISDNSMLPKL